MSTEVISRDVFESRGHGVANDMSVAQRRASYLSILWDRYNLSCALFTPGGDLFPPE